VEKGRGGWGKCKGCMYGSGGWVPPGIGRTKKSPNIHPAGGWMQKELLKKWGKKSYSEEKKSRKRKGRPSHALWAWAPLAGGGGMCRGKAKENKKKIKNTLRGGKKQPRPP